MYATPLQTSTAELTALLESLLSWPEIIGVVALVLAAWAVYQRTQSSADPTGSFAIQTATGSASVSISGAYWIALLVGVVALVTWPLPMEFPLFGAAHVLLVGIAWWLEREEAM